ncbi:MAG TPA: CU044_2847 family protein [Acetobacteraceae bacterium]|nr:CU044_2847 family protein [Acetobacteraceae bacterium]
MTKLVRFRLEGGDSVIVQVDDQESGPVPAASPGEIAAKAAMTFEQATSKLGPIARAVLAQVENLGPDETSVELGLKFSAEAGVILAKSAAEGTCKITIKWKKGG